MALNLVGRVAVWARTTESTEFIPIKRNLESSPQSSEMIVYAVYANRQTLNFEIESAFYLKRYTYQAFRSRS